MLTHKRVNRIIICFVILATLFTGLFMFSPQTLGIKVANASSKYEEKLFNKEAIQSINIVADPTQWANMLKDATSEEYISCDLTINGETYYSVGIRPKGNSSLTMVANDDTTDRFSFKIKMDEYVDDQTYYGLSKFVINNMQGDATYMKEYLSYDMFDSMGVETPLYAFTDVSLNGEDWGLYLAVETIEEEFAQRSYGSDHGELYKPETADMAGGMGGKNGNRPEMPRNTSDGAMQMPDPENMENGAMQMPDHVSHGGMQIPGQRPETASNGAIGGRPGGGPEGMGDSGGGADLVYVDDDTDSYSQIFENTVFKTKKSDWKRVVSALQHLDSGKDLEDYVDVDEVLKYFAVNTAIVNLDSYVSNFKHNYYLYEKDGQISILPWDLNLSFAGFQSGDATSAVNFPIDTPVMSGGSLEERPLIGTLIDNEDGLEEYHAYMQQLLDDYFNSGRFQNTIDQLDALIGNHVKKDATAFYTYDQYQAGVKTLKEFGKLRAESIQGQLDGTVASTHDTQKEDSKSLIDGSGITISDMGSQGRGGEMGPQDKREDQQNQEGGAQAEGGKVTN